MDANERIKLLQRLTNITRDIQNQENEIKKHERIIAEKRTDESNIYNMLGMKNPNTKHKRISPEKVTIIRSNVIGAMEELHAMNLKWLGMRVIVNVVRKKFTGATIPEIENQIRVMGREGMIEHNGIRGSGSSYRIKQSDIAQQ